MVYQSIAKYSKVKKWQKMTGNDRKWYVRKCQEIVTKSNIQNETGKNNFVTKYSFLKKLSCLIIKVIPWTARASSRSKIGENMVKTSDEFIISHWTWSTNLCQITTIIVRSLNVSAAYNPILNKTCNLICHNFTHFFTFFFSKQDKNVS